MDLREIAVSFTLSKEEAQRETDAVAKRAGAGKIAMWSMRVLALLWLGMGVIELATNHASGQGWLDVVVGVSYGALGIARSVKVRKISPGDTTVRFSEEGVFFERPASREFSWNDIRYLIRSDTAYFLYLDRAAAEPPFDRPIAIPASALGENRIALWELAERMMIGPLRPVSAQLSMDRSGALRRTDTASIVNRHAKIA
jgi:hypothetical protein